MIRTKHGTPVEITGLSKHDGFVIITHNRREIETPIHDLVGDVEKEIDRLEANINETKTI